MLISSCVGHLRLQSSELHREQNRLAMKKIYTPVILISFFILSACSKDYQERIVGDWRIDDIDRVGIGGSTGSLPFKEGGSFSFRDDGTMTYTNPSGSLFKGTWNIQKKVLSGDDNTNVYQSLQITAVNFTSQEILGEYYDDIDFRGSNHIRAEKTVGARTYITHLRR